MPFRYTLVAGAAGLFSAWWFSSAAGGFIAVFGCCVLYALRSIELQLRDLKGRIPTARDMLVHYGTQASPKMIRTTHEFFDGETEPMIGSRAVTEFLTEPATFAPSAMRVTTRSGKVIYRDPTIEEKRAFIGAAEQRVNPAETTRSPQSTPTTMTIGDTGSTPAEA
ncbi:hypothetical protein [Bradyrhizobium sp. SZCCHNRI3037]|uniref:hypothetical protein n=1 Tax=Bradyrhizobium sp. SZCCHNRI3037 TaxID=3057290 RepID=UPI002916E413|nr:hypothetical protein [Bradyrhizobium sp. SZCCHNRI3037]